MHTIAVAAGLALALITGTAAGQATRTWVSGVGDDANPCSRTAPCKTFAGAISKTAAGGEIDVLDPGAYGAVTITKSITIDGAGGFAGGILSPSVNGVTVNAAGIVVALRNLVINGAGTGLNGVRVLAFGRLHLDNVTIGGVAGAAVDVSAAAPGRVEIRNSTFRAPCAIGFRSTTTVGTIQTLLSNVSIDGCTTGIDALANSRVAVRHSTVSHAVMAVGASAGAVVALDNAFVGFANSGVVAHGGATVVRISDSTITENVQGLSSLAGGTLLSFGNNLIHGNTTNGSPTSTLGEQ
ncbi:MAG: hypothetical protein KJ018_14105 [Burkholderiales bacterium]|nr:hypothetical protein [Burkholderiales bacterium]